MSSGDKMAPFQASEMAWVCHVREYFITSDNFAPSLKFEFNHPSLPPYPQFYL